MGKSLYLLFESAYGYGIFKVIEAEELASSLPKVLNNFIKYRYKKQ